MFDLYKERLWIKPESYGLDQRIEASEKATEAGTGLRMEVHNAHTEFWLDADVPVGKVSVWQVMTYKGQLEYLRTMNSASDPYDPWEPRDD
jgi:hypothetical protein